MNQYLKTKSVAPEMLFCDGIVADDQNVWIIATALNILMGIRRDSGEIFLCKLISKCDINKVPYRYLFKYGEKLLLFPYEERNICIYDINKNEFEYIELDITNLKEDPVWKFTGCEKIGDKIIVYGLCPIVLIISLPTWEIIYLDLKKKLPKDWKITYWFWEYSYSKDNKLFLVPLTYPCIIEMDICDNSVQYHKIPDKKEVYIDNPVFDESFLYYIDRKREGMVALAKYNLESGKVELYNLGIEKKAGSYRTFGFISCVNNALWMLPGVCGDGYKFYISEEKFEKLNDLPVISEEKLGSSFPHEFNYRNGILDKNGHILSIHAWTCQLIDIDTVEGKIKVLPISKSEDVSWSKLIDEVYNNCSCGIHTEWADWMLEVFLKKIAIVGKVENKDIQTMIGGNIYQKLSKGS